MKSKSKKNRRTKGRRRTLPKMGRSVVIRKKMQKVLEDNIKKMRAEATRKLANFTDASDLQKALKEFEKKWKSIFTELAKSLSKTFTQGITKHVDTNFISMDPKYKIDHLSDDVKNVVTSIRNEVSTTITNIPDDLVNSYSHIMNNAVGAYDQGAIVKQLTTRTNVALRRSELIARDQVAKAMERYQMSRARDLGFEYYVWETSLDERVARGKGGHVQLHGRIYKYGIPTAIIDSEGTVGIPSQRINCRCTALPLFVEPGDKLTLVKDAAAGDYYTM